MGHWRLSWIIRIRLCFFYGLLLLIVVADCRRNLRFCFLGYVSLRSRPPCVHWLTRLSIRPNMGPLLRLRMKSFAIKLWGNQHWEWQEQWLLQTSCCGRFDDDASDGDKEDNEDEDGDDDVISKEINHKSVTGLQLRITLALSRLIDQITF